MARLHFLTCSCVEETEKREKKSQKDHERSRFAESNGRSWASALSPVHKSPSLHLPLCIRGEAYFWSEHLSKLKHISYPCNIHMTQYTYWLTAISVCYSHKDQTEGSSGGTGRRVGGEWGVSREIMGLME